MKASKTKINWKKAALWACGTTAAVAIGLAIKNYGWEKCATTAAEGVAILYVAGVCLWVLKQKWPWQPPAPPSKTHPTIHETPHVKRLSKDSTLEND